MIGISNDVRVSFSSFLSPCLLEWVVDALTGQSTYSSVIDTVYHGNEDYLENGGSYDDVQWVSIDYLLSGNVEMGKKYYDIASTAVDSTYCGGGCKPITFILISLSNTGLDSVLEWGTRLQKRYRMFRAIAMNNFPNNDPCRLTNYIWLHLVTCTRKPRTINI